MYTRSAAGHWQGPTRLWQPLSPWGTHHRPFWVECQAGAQARSWSRQLLAGHRLDCACAAGTSRRGGLGRWLSPACFLRQPSLEETSCLLLLLSGSPSVCPACMAELLPSPLPHNLSAHMEIPLRAHPRIPTLPAPCPVCAAIPTTPSWRDQPPIPCFHLQPLRAGSGMLGSPAEGLAHSCAHSGAGQGIWEYWWPEDRCTQVPTSTRSHSAPSMAGAGAPLDTRPLRGTLKHGLPSY